MEANAKKLRLNTVIKDIGMLLLNENKQFLSVMELGGDWDTIMSLIEEREVFFSKVYKKRTTYLSRELYFLLKRFRQRTLLGYTEQKIYEFLSQCGGADTETIKAALMIEDKKFKKAMDKLLESMNVTVLHRARTLNPQWSSFLWGTFEQWEEGCENVELSQNDDENMKKIESILIKSMSRKEIHNFLNGRGKNGSSYIQDF